GAWRDAESLGAAPLRAIRSWLATVPYISADEQSKVFETSDDIARGLSKPSERMMARLQIANAFEARRPQVARAILDELWVQQTFDERFLRVIDHLAPLLPSAEELREALELARRIAVASRSEPGAAPTPSANGRVEPKTLVAPEKRAARESASAENAISTRFRGVNLRSAVAEL